MRILLYVLIAIKKNFFIDRYCFITVILLLLLLLLSCHYCHYNHMVIRMGYTCIYIYIYMYIYIYIYTFSCVHLFIDYCFWLHVLA